MEKELHTALYFPHTEVRSESLVRNALLTWDSLEYIAPDKDYTPRYESKHMAEAMEIIGSKRTVTDDERLRVHKLVKDLLQDDVPEIFRYVPTNGERYEIWPQKLARETWELLKQRGLTDGVLPNRDYPTSEAAGLSLMAILADVLAGETRARITDRAQAYAAIANATKSTSNAHDHDSVVPLTFKAVCLDQVPFERLIDFRKREASSSGGGDYRKLRHNYLHAINSHVESISKISADSEDRRELDRVFAEKMEDDFRDLKRELRFAKGEAWLSKDVITLTLAGIALLGGPVIGQHIAIPEVISGAGGAVLLGGALGTELKLSKSRREILRKHPMAYLYEVQL